MPQLTVYQKPTCTTCRKVHELLLESGVDFQAVNYYIKPLSRSKLKSLLAKMGISARELLRKNEPIYKELKLAERNLTEEEITELMVKHPDLIQRPIIEKGDRAILARPPEKLKLIL